MPLETHRKTATLRGHATVEEAETLLAWLIATPNGKLDLSTCDSMHTAVLQVVLALQPKISKTPANPRLAEVLRAAVSRESHPEPA